MARYIDYSNVRKVASYSDKKITRTVAMITWLLFMLLFGFTQPEVRPHGIHAWAQADRLAVAYGFYENNLDFSRPATYSLNSEGGRVGVEFPAIQYLSAALAKPLGKSYIPLIYRWLNYIFLISSMLFLGFSIRQHRVRWLVVWVLSLSPVFLYYGFNFLPDTTALATGYFGLGCFLRSRPVKNGTINRPAMLGALLIFGLAALFKATSGIYLLIFGGYYCYQFIRQKHYRQTAMVSALVLSLAIIVALFDYYYVIQTNKELWSVVFMSNSNPVNSLSDAGHIISGLWNWVPEYFGWLSGILMIIALVVVTIDLVKGRNKFRLVPLVLLSLAGVIGILWLFGLQFINHDYYFVSSFYLLFSGLICYLFIRGSAVLPGVFKPNILWLVLIGLSAVPVFSQARDRGADHYEGPSYTFDNHVNWLRNGDRVLDAAGIPDDAVIFVLYEDAPNLSLLYFGRKGMTFNFEELGRESSPLFYWQERLRPDYYIIEKVWLERLSTDLPDFSAARTTVLETDQFVVMK